MRVTILQTIFIFISIALSAVIPPEEQNAPNELLVGEINPEEEPDFLSIKELEYLKGDPDVTHKVSFTISQRVSDSESKKLGKLTIALFGKTVPLTVENFYQLSTRTLKHSYQDVLFHRIIKGFMVQGGEIKTEKGESCSIYGGNFKDENFELKHDKLGRVSMANSSPDRNGCQFFILNVGETPHLDGHHVVFGQLVDGFDTLETISNVNVGKQNKPKNDIYVSDIEAIKRSEEMKEPLDEIEQAHKDQTNQEFEFGDEKKVAQQEPPVSEGYSYFIIMLLVGVILVGVLYYQLIHRRKKITAIRQDKFF
ncbi:uncharacterized protein SPAPADRAFT_61825 [Spathaspora passalidarum NRRL Y-27907]|uniref:peptidylprolyl isomerase n=1 Tax=Spathaspora passalidarum (strain NRRL Y-27907 / 11-Y1) TaxID=619300 RepID=G3AR73_SPAPN|nr:uncharacterized protein SPAPADRAFT_61825 [Spathaspora passalidarum NRRL Y-27907]EGW31248.1 hypothetical protein SPAPADRAFT_61825 [Spathaspora passalidarum NRRL Y-27907]